MPLTTGISGGGAVAVDMQASFVNVTFAGNKVMGHPGFLQSLQQYGAPPQGAAVLAQSVTLEHTTFIENQGASAIQATSLTSARSVAIPVAGTTVCAPGAAAAPSTYNWFADASCGLTGATNRQENAAFLLGSLVDTGSGVPVRAPERGSVLIDVVPAASCPVTSDARGLARPQGALVTSGRLKPGSSEPFPHSHATHFA